MCAIYSAGTIYLKTEPVQRPTTTSTTNTQKTTPPRQKRAQKPHPLELSSSSPPSPPYTINSSALQQANIKMTQTEALNDMNAVTTTDENNKNTATETALSVLSTWVSKDDDDDDKDSDPFRIVRKTKLQKLSSRECFEERLKTFHSVTYFCKPTVLSPMVCARFGYVYSQKWNGVE